MIYTPEQVEFSKPMEIARLSGLRLTQVSELWQALLDSGMDTEDIYYELIDKYGRRDPSGRSEWRRRAEEGLEQIWKQAGSPSE